MDAEIAGSASAVQQAEADLAAAEEGLEKVTQAQRSQMEGAYKSLVEAKDAASREVVKCSAAAQNKRKMIEEEFKARRSVEQQSTRRRGVVRVRALP